MAKPPTPPESSVAPVKPHADSERPLPKKFYTAVAVEQQDNAFTVLLDGRSVRTPQRAAFMVPTHALAEAVAAEWRQQSDVINPETMPLTKLCNSTLDGVCANRDLVIDDIANYANHDAICYRADTPDELVARQTEALDPVIDWAEQTLGVRWMCTVGVMPVVQPASCAQAVRAALADVTAFHIAVLHQLTTLTGSALLALAYQHQVLSFDRMWQAAHIDEDFQIERWGQDSEAEARRQQRHHEAAAADRLFKLVGTQNP